VLVSHRNDLTVVGPDLVKAGDALDEWSALGPGGPGAVLCQREDRDGFTSGSKHVDPLVAILKRQVDPRVPGNTSPTGEVEPDRPLGITRTWRAL
jgi:hypothetical protein